MNTLNMIADINGGWKFVIAEFVVILICSAVLYLVCHKQKMSRRFGMLFSIGFFLFNTIAYEIMISLLFFPGGEYYNHGLFMSLVFLAIMMTIPLVLSAVIVLTIYLFRKKYTVA